MTTPFGFGTPPMSTNSIGRCVASRIAVESTASWQQRWLRTAILAKVEKLARAAGFGALAKRAADAARS